MRMDVGQFADAVVLTSNVLRDVPQQAQTQESLNTQLLVLRVAAHRLGLYDAEDWLKKNT